MNNKYIESSYFVKKKITQKQKTPEATGNALKTILN